MKALVIVDMQNDFLTGPLGNNHCCNAIEPVKNLIKNESWDLVCLTKDTHTENYSKTLEGEKLPIKHCVLDTNGWAIEQSIIELVDKLGLNRIVINKPTFGSFDLAKDIFNEYEYRYGDQSAKILGRGYDLEFHVCGVCTSICVLANVVILRATWPDAKIIVHANACGDVTKEMHEAAKICFASQQCEVVGE